MKHSTEELMRIVYRYYPRGLLADDLRYTQSEEYRRLEAARRRAGAENDLWRTMLRRLGDHFPQNSVQNRSLHLPAGGCDACYSARIYLSTNVPGEYYHHIGFLVSFLAPYYLVYSVRCVDDLEEMGRRKAHAATPPRHISVGIGGDTMLILPAWLSKLIKLVKPERLDPSPPMEVKRQAIAFDFSTDEHPYAAWIAQDIEAIWGYERMPSEIGKLNVPDVATNLRNLGEATLYDCLLSDNW